MAYTTAAVLGVLIALALDLAVLRTRLVTRRVFWATYAIVVFFQLIVNGLLTGLDIAQYAPGDIIGLRIVFAPVEDLLFGVAMVLVTLTLWIWTGRRAARSTRRAGRADPPTPGAVETRSPGS